MRRTLFLLCILGCDSDSAGPSGPGTVYAVERLSFHCNDQGGYCTALAIARDGVGAPVVGAYVEIHSTGTTSATHDARTNHDGWFQVRGFADDPDDRVWTCAAARRGCDPHGDGILIIGTP